MSKKRNQRRSKKKRRKLPQKSARMCTMSAKWSPKPVQSCKSTNPPLLMKRLLQSLLSGLVKSIHARLRRRSLKTTRMKRRLKLQPRMIRG